MLPVVIPPKYQNLAIGGVFIRDGLTQAAREHWKAAFVLGGPDYYSRFGLRIALSKAFETEYSKAYYMALELTPNALKGDSGSVVYAPPFLALG